ncbi:MAG TPA: hypothetical protein VJS44_08175 [Pyrinomonadaceae bacterium]|nr:hypothetical protein [Pyrinomonadaceae bacterium]
MRKIIATLALLSALTIPVFADGNTPLPGVKPTPEPPACTENCGNDGDSGTGLAAEDPSLYDLVETWLSVIV